MRTLTLSLLMLFLAAACGPSHQDVYDEHLEYFTAMRGAFQEIHGALPPEDAGADAAGLSGLSPLPTFSETPGAGNTEIVMDWQLLAPGAAKGERMDLLLAGRLLTYVRWAGPDSPMSESLAGNTADESFHEELAGALQTRYLLVVRQLAYDAPRVDLAKDEYHGGSATLQAFLFDLPSRKVLGAIQFTAVASGDIEYSYSEGGGDQQERAEAWARSRIWETAREQLCDMLAAETGGTFELN